MLIIKFVYFTINVYVMNKVLVLNSSILLRKPLIKEHNIKLQYGKIRVNQYIKGFESLKNQGVFDLFENILLIDNTCRNTSKVPKKIARLLPENTVFNFTNKNTFGLLNKGAGVIDSLCHSKDLINKYEFVFYFEPKLILNNRSFIDNFLDLPRNLFVISEEYPQVKSGYFGTESSELIKFLKSVNIQKMIDEKLNLENLIYDFFNQKSDFIKGTFTSWFDSGKRRYVDY